MTEKELERIVHRAITVVVDNIYEVSKENPTIVSLDLTLALVKERWEELGGFRRKEKGND